MKVLIIGGSGLLGMKLWEVCEEKNYDVYASFHQNPITRKNCFQMDITRKKDVFHVLRKVSPDWVVHTAAYTNVDDCEKNRNRAFDVNVKGTENVANAVEKIDAKLVYISTDYVFDGEKGFYKEDDLVNPVNYYGLTKLEGEKVVKNICRNFAIARTSVIYGGNKRNFVTWVIEHLAKGEQINIVTDQFVSPTFNVDLAEQLLGLIRNDERGVFHTAGRERISRYDFTMVVADVFGLDKDLINPVKMDDVHWLARRPLDSSLDVSKISEIKKPYIVKEAVRLLQEAIGR
jgi:dTDP-4-dehydrorhamnose reductase